MAEWQVSNDFNDWSDCEEYKAETAKEAAEAAFEQEVLRMNGWNTAFEQEECPEGQFNGSYFEGEYDADGESGYPETYTAYLYVREKE